MKFVHPSSEALTGDLGAPLEARARLPPATPAQAALSRQLHAKCLYLPAGWWSYELCHGHHVRQFHVSQAHAVEQVNTLGAPALAIPPPPPLVIIPPLYNLYV